MYQVFLNQLLVHACVHAHLHTKASCVELRGQLCGVSSLHLPLSGSWELHGGSRLALQTPSPHWSHLTGLWHKHVMETIEHTGFTLEKSGCEAGKGKMSWNLWNKVLACLPNLWARACRPVCYEKLLGAKEISHQCGRFTTLYRWIQWTLIQPQIEKFFWYTYDMDGP